MTFPRPNVDIFRNARQNFLRRQQAGEDADLERQAPIPQQQPPQPAEELYEPPHAHPSQQHPALRTPAPPQEMAERPSPARTFITRWSGFQRPSFNFMPGSTPRQPAAQAPPRPSSSRYSSSEAESPKTPLFNFLPSRSRRETQRFSLHGARPSMSGARGSDEIAEPAAALAADMLGGRSRERRRFDGVDPAELHLAGLAEDGRERRERRHRHRDGRRRRHRHHEGHSSGSRRSEDSEGRRSRRRRPPPRNFLFCFPWIKSRTTRNLILRCFVSGIFLTLILTVYLALSLSNPGSMSSEFTLLFIIFILFATIIFCHGLIRLCISIVRPKPPSSPSSPLDPSLRAMYGPGGYAIPAEPIRVTLARDEEAAGIASEEGKKEPPAYGRWRESVRVDPDRIFWARSEAGASPVLRGGSGGGGEAEEERPATSASRRPPSYISDDGVSYVVEAQGRSTVPTVDVPLPVHPSEVGRVRHVSDFR